MKTPSNISMAMLSGLFMAAGGAGHLAMGAWSRGARPGRRVKTPDAEIQASAAAKRERKRARNLRNGL